MADNAVVYLTHCLLEMAEAETNPVLQVIDIPIVENKKYPSKLLTFNQLGWRSYYHCHPSTRAGNHHFKGEHGHFHIFVRTQTDPETWSHMAALAMNNMGQPLGWFTVNHWVTGEVWTDADILSKQLESIPFDHQSLYNIVERWLLSLLATSKDDIKTILNERDEILKQEQLKFEEMDVKQIKEIYLLSEIPINLMSLLDIRTD